MIKAVVRKTVELEEIKSAWIDSIIKDDIEIHICGRMDYDEIQALKAALEEEQAEIVKYIVEDGWALSEALNILKGHKYDILEASNDEELGRAIVDMYHKDNPLKDFVDYKALGRDYHNTRYANYIKLKDGRQVCIRMKV